MLCQWITSIFPPSHCTIFPGAGSRTLSHLLPIRWKWAQIWKKRGEAFLFFATACLFSPPCLCLLREGSICTSCFWRAELRYCLLNAELCRIWTSFRNYNRKKIHCYYFEMLFVPTTNPAGFIYMCLLVISLFSANPTKQEFSVFPQLGLQPQFADKHRLARAVHSKGVSPCKAHRIMSSLCKTIKRRKMLAKWKKKIKLVQKKRTYLQSSRHLEIKKLKAAKKLFSVLFITSGQCLKYCVKQGDISKFPIFNGMHHICPIIRHDKPMRKRKQGVKPLFVMQLLLHIHCRDFSKLHMCRRTLAGGRELWLPLPEDWKEKDTQWVAIHMVAIPLNRCLSLTYVCGLFHLLSSCHLKFHIDFSLAPAQYCLK